MNISNPIRGDIGNGVNGPLVGKWGGQTIAQQVAALFEGDNWSYYDPSNVASTWQETTPLTPADDVGEVIGLCQDYTGSFNATQASAALKATRQAGNVIRYDGTNDVHVTSGKAGSSSNTLAVKLTAPASVPSAEIIMGCNGAAGRWYISINASGIISGGAGGHSLGTIVGTTDIRGLTGTAAFVENGSTVKLYWEGAEEYSAAQSGNPDTTEDMYLGALNSSGSASSHFNGDIHYAIRAEAEKSAAEILSLTNLWS